ncbi:hypothetical protein GCM10009628_17290 [Paeniglutamicibacter kerguelensis]|uniref:STAS/SEC14 domain-containing protein n=1 Tax=Paeniglutamicibacter kerguelensis TaxID=254788 RepID=A0ABS4XJG1_9MICC|nr:hypothetical protein [Paeniglutamicibacter kerguelensis]
MSGNLSTWAVADERVADETNDPQGVALCLWIWSGAQARMAFFADDLLEIRFKAGTTLSLSTMMEMLDYFERQASGLRAHLVIDISGLDDVEADVPPRFNRLIRNLRAAMLGSGPADQVLARFFMRKLDGDRTCAYFERRSDAVEFVLRNA